MLSGPPSACDWLWLGWLVASLPSSPNPAAWRGRLVTWRTGLAAGERLRWSACMLRSY